MFKSMQSKRIIYLVMAVAISLLCVATYFYLFRDATVLVARLQTPRGIMTFNIPSDLVWRQGYEARENDSEPIGIEMVCIFPDAESEAQSGQKLPISTCGPGTKFVGFPHDPNAVFLLIDLAPDLRDITDPATQSPLFRMGDELREDAVSDIDGTKRYDIYSRGEKSNYSVYKLLMAGDASQVEPLLFCQEAPVEYGSLHCFFDYQIDGAFVTTSFDQQKRRFWKQIDHAVRSEVASFQQRL